MSFDNLMKNSALKLIFVLLLMTVMLPSSSYTQIFVTKCPLDSITSNNDGNNPKNHPLLPTSGTLKVLIIYCQFIDDYFNYPPYSDMWPWDIAKVPDWAMKTVTRSAGEQWTNPSLSGYYDEMSRGKLKITGDVCPKLIVPRLPSYYYSNHAGYNISYLTKEILDKADPYVNYSDYDNYDPDDYNHNGNLNEPDGTADMIIICFRSIPIGIWNIDDGGYYSGIASLTGTHKTFPDSMSYIIRDGVKIKAGVHGSGTFQHNIFDPDGQLHIMAHEIGHYYFNGTIAHLFGTGYYTLMSGVGCGIMSGFEREILGWVQPVTVTKNMTNVALTDAITTGCVYKIPIPNPDHNYPLNLYVENYQSNGFYTTRWLRSNVWGPNLQNTGVILTEANSSVYLSDIKCADGKWDWDRKMYMWFHPWILKDWLYTLPFKHFAPNPDSGGMDEMMALGLRVNKDDASIRADHPDALGDAEDFFNINYNDVYSRWSNPGLYPYSTAHICVELTRQIYNSIYANFYVEGNTDILAKPSKPQLYKIELANGNYPKITWLEGREPDLVKYYIFRKSGLSGSWDQIGTTAKDVSEYTDNTAAGDTVYYKIQSQDNQGKLSIFSDIVSIGDGKPTPSEKVYTFSLDQNFPNPFNPETGISFTLSKQAYLKLKVYDVLGKEITRIFEGTLPEGRHEFKWNAANYPSGVYFYRLETPGITISRKMVFEK